MKTKRKRNRKAKRGRPTLLDVRLQERICERLADANTIAVSCESLGIGVSTYHQWRAKYPDFLAATTRARAEARIKLVKEIKRLSCDDWRGWAWLASRLFPGDFARTAPRVIVVERPPAPAEPVIEQRAARKRTVEWLVKDAGIFNARQLRYFNHTRDFADSLAADGNGDG